VAVKADSKHRKGISGQCMLMPALKNDVFLKTKPKEEYK